MATLATIGDVTVVVGRPPQENPYRGEGLMGPEREEALVRYRDGGDTTAWSFWYAPAGGGARELDSPDQVDWRGMRR